MATISETTISNAVTSMEFWISKKVSLKFVSKGLFDNKSALVQVIAWRQTGDKPLPYPMMTQLNDAYMRHPALLGEKQILIFPAHWNCHCS